MQSKQGVLKLSTIPAALRSLCEDMDSKKLSSFQELKSDALMNGKGTDALLKSGRFRAGAHKVRKVIPWTQDLCIVTSLSVLQWVQGIIYCALDGHNQTVKANIPINHGSVLQDAIELS